MAPEPSGPAQLARESPGRTAVIQVESDHHEIRLRREAGFFQDIHFLAGSNVAHAGIDQFHAPSVRRWVEQALGPVDVNLVRRQVITPRDRVSQYQNTELLRALSRRELAGAEAQGIDLHVYVETGKLVLQDSYMSTWDQSAPLRRVSDQQVRIARNKRTRRPGRDNPGRVRAEPGLEYAQNHKGRDNDSSEELSDQPAPGAAASWSRPAGFGRAVKLHLRFRSAIRSWGHSVNHNAQALLVIIPTCGLE